jgi:hypothetical protein
VSQDKEQPGTVNGVAAIPVAINDMAVGTVRDVEQLPRVTAEASSSPQKREGIRRAASRLSGP